MQNQAMVEEEIIIDSPTMAPHASSLDDSGGVEGDGKKTQVFVRFVAGMALAMASFDPLRDGAASSSSSSSTSSFRLWRSPDSDLQKKLSCVEEEYASLQRQRSEDCKANAKVMRIVANREQKWKLERRRLRRDLQRLRDYLATSVDLDPKRTTQQNRLEIFETNQHQFVLSSDSEKNHDEHICSGTDPQCAFSETDHQCILNSAKIPQCTLSDKNHRCILNSEKNPRCNLPDTSHRCTLSDTNQQCTLSDTNHRCVLSDTNPQYCILSDKNQQCIPDSERNPQCTLSDTNRQCTLSDTKNQYCTLLDTNQQCIISDTNHRCILSSEDNPQHALSDTDHQCILSDNNDRYILSEINPQCSFSDTNQQRVLSDANHRCSLGSENNPQCTLPDTNQQYCILPVTNHRCILSEKNPKCSLSDTNPQCILSDTNHRCILLEKNPQHSLSDTNEQSILSNTNCRCILSEKNSQCALSDTNRQCILNSEKNTQYCTLSNTYDHQCAISDSNHRCILHSEKNPQCILSNTNHRCTLSDTNCRCILSDTNDSQCILSETNTRCVLSEKINHNYILSDTNDCRCTLFESKSQQCVLSDTDDHQCILLDKNRQCIFSDTNDPQCVLSDTDDHQCILLDKNRQCIFSDTNDPQCILSEENHQCILSDLRSKHLELETEMASLFHEFESSKNELTSLREEKQNADKLIEKLEKGLQEKEEIIFSMSERVTAEIDDRLSLERELVIAKAKCRHAEEVKEKWKHLVEEERPGGHFSPRKISTLAPVRALPNSLHLYQGKTGEMEELKALSTPMDRSIAKNSEYRHVEARKQITRFVGSDEANRSAVKKPMVFSKANHVDLGIDSDWGCLDTEVGKWKKLYMAAKAAIATLQRQKDRTGATRMTPIIYDRLDRDKSQHRHWQKAEAIERHMKAKDERLEAFRWQLVSMEREAIERSKEIATLMKSVEISKEEKTKVENDLMEREIELRILRDRLTCMEIGSKISGGGGNIVSPSSNCMENKGEALQ